MCTPSPTFETLVLQTIGGESCLLSIYLGKLQQKETHSSISVTIGQSTIAASVFSIGIMLSALPWFQAQRHLVTNARKCKVAFIICRYAEFAFLLLWLWVQMNNASPAIVGRVHSAFAWLWIITQYITCALIINCHNRNTLWNSVVAKLVCCIPLTVWNLVSGYFIDSGDKQVFLVAESFLLSVYLLANVFMTYFLTEEESSASSMHSQANIVIATKDMQTKNQQENPLLRTFVF